MTTPPIRLTGRTDGVLVGGVERLQVNNTRWQNENQDQNFLSFLYLLASSILRTARVSICSALRFRVLCQGLAM
jgi:hypothetical protein